MKKIFFIISISLLFASLFAEEIFIQEQGRIFKVVISENGDTLSKEEISIVPMDTIAKETIAEPLKEIEQTEIAPQPELYNPQLLRIVPFKWQAGWYGAWQGFPYGVEIAMGFGIMEKKYAPLIYLSTPTLMFFLPPILIKDDVPDYSLAFIDWGYRLGPLDYFVLKSGATKSEFGKTYSVGNLDVMPDALAAMAFGYTESWGGYALSRKLGPFRRAASDMYAAGSYMGYIWGGLLGGYLTTKLVEDNPNEPQYTDTMNYDTLLFNQYLAEVDSVQNIIDSLNQKREAIGYPPALFSSIGLRVAGFYFGNQEKYGLKSFDGYFYTFNSITGFLLANELDNYIDVEDEMLLIHTAMSMLTTGATAYLMKDIHLDDGNAILMMIGGIVGGSLGQGIQLVIESYTNENFASEPKFHTSIGAICMIAGEFGVYMLRKDAIQNGSDFGSNLGFNLYPTKNNGLGVNLSYSF